MSKGVNRKTLKKFPSTAKSKTKSTRSLTLLPGQAQILHLPSTPTSRAPSTTSMATLVRTMGGGAGPIAGAYPPTVQHSIETILAGALPMGILPDDGTLRISSKTLGRRSMLSPTGGRIPPSPSQPTVAPATLIALGFDLATRTIMEGVTKKVGGTLTGWPGRIAMDLILQGRDAVRTLRSLHHRPSPSPLKAIIPPHRTPRRGHLRTTI
jgi:hypothetical protein